jgi:purine-binding chemotaxis protein CheW
MKSIYKAGVENSESEQLLCFSIDKENFGIEISHVQEVIRLSNLTKLPKAPNFVKGVINLRGNVIPMIDLREKFGFDTLDYHNSTRAIIMDLENSQIGFIVDEVSRVQRVPVNSIQESKSFSSYNAEFIDGISNHNNNILIILNMNKILDKKEIIQLSTEISEN